MKEVAIGSKLYRPAGDPRATYLLTQKRGAGLVYVHEDRITAVFMPGAEGAGQFCVSSAEGRGYYVMQDGEEYWGGGMARKVPTVFHMRKSGGPVVGWVLEIYGAEEV
jgi:hypothetical protein